MQHLTLTSTTLFQTLQQGNNVSCLDTAYNEFIKEVFGICSKEADAKIMVLTMTYTEIELQYLIDGNSIREEHLHYIRKMIAFLRKTVERIRHYQFNSRLHTTPERSSEYRWTGNGIDLVEIVYGLVEMECIDSGNTPIHELIQHISTFFGIEIKDCYSAYVDMKRRKNDSRTYFLDKMCDRLNKRMQCDDSREMIRK